MVAPRFQQPDPPRIRCVIVEVVPSVDGPALDRADCQRAAFDWSGCEDVAVDRLAALRAEADPQVAALVHRLARRVADEIRDEQNGGWPERSELPPTRWQEEFELPEEYDRGAWQVRQRPLRRPR